MYAQIVERLLVIVHTADYDEHWHTMSSGSLGYGPYALAMQSLNIEMSFGSNHEISRRQMSVEVQRIEDHAGPGEQFCVEKSYQTCTQATRCPRTGKIEHVRAEVPFDYCCIVPQCVIQFSYHSRCCALLRTIDSASTFGATERIIHITSYLYNRVMQTRI